MVKYIDLLREHQKKGKEKKKEPSTNIDTIRMEAMVEKETDNEKEGAKNAFSPLDTFTNNPLLAETTRKFNHPLLQPGRSDSISSALSDVGADRKEKSADDQQKAALSGWLDELIRLIDGMFSASAKGDPYDFTPVSKHLDQFINQLKEDRHIIDALELEVSNREKDEEQEASELKSLVQKSVKMMLYGVKLGNQLQMQQADLRALLLAAMTHNIGMAQIDPAILSKKEKLTDAELKLIRQIPQTSYDYLNLCGITDPIILMAANQNQERFDGSGPQGIKGTNIALSGRIVGLLTTFEALIHYRPYRKRLLPRDAIRTLVSNHSKSFDPSLIKALIESISLYPVGTYVQLNTGDVGLVTRVHLRHPLRPVVHLKFNASGEEIPLREIDLKTQPNLMVQKCMYEEELESLRNGAGGAS